MIKNSDFKICFSVMTILTILVGLFQSWGIALSMLNLCLISSVMAMGVNIQWGFAGLINFGVMGFLAIGGLATVLISVPPVPEAWSAGGIGILISGLFLLAVVFSILIINKRLPNHKYKNYFIFLIIILSIPLLKFIAGPSISRIESINAATSGFLGGVTAGGGGASQQILYPNIAGQPGGSGGGGDGSNSPGDPGGSAVDPGVLGGGTYYGNAGGSGGPRADGGGGGGAGGAGNPDGGTGGAGRPFPAFAYPLCFPSPYLPGFATPGNPKSGYSTSPTSDHYGGGGGGSQAESSTPQAGGAGGGGASSYAPADNQSYPTTKSGKDGLEYLGAGAGGGQTQAGVGGNPGGQGGKGVVIIRYLAS